MLCENDVDRSPLKSYSMRLTIVTYVLKYLIVYLSLATQTIFIHLLRKSHSTLKYEKYINVRPVNWEIKKYVNWFSEKWVFYFDIHVFTILGVWSACYLQLHRQWIRVWPSHKKQETCKYSIYGLPITRSNIVTGTRLNVADYHSN